MFGHAARLYHAGCPGAETICFLHLISTIGAEVMQIVKCGNSLAVRLPADLVRKLGLMEGDHVDLRADGNGISVARRRRPDEVLSDLARFRGRLPAADRLGRDDARER